MGDTSYVQSKEFVIIIFFVSMMKDPRPFFVDHYLRFPESSDLIFEGPKKHALFLVRALKSGQRLWR